MIYLVVFFTAICLFIAGEKYKSNILGRLFSFLGILLPSILAGLRDVTVGTDTGGYVYYFQYISGLNYVTDLFGNAYLERLHLELGYRLLNFLISRFTSDAHWMLGILAFLTILFVYEGARNYEDRYPVWLIMSSFLFIYFCNDLNVARQGLAVAIVFYAYRFLELKKYVKFIAISLIAMSMHSITGLAIPILLIVFVFLRDREFSFKRHAVIVIALFSVLWFYRYLVGLFLLVFSQYKGYVELYGSGTPFSLAAIIIRLPFLLIATLYYRSIIKRNHFYNVYYIFLIIDLVVSQFGNLYGPFARLTWYFSYYKLLIIPDVYQCYNLTSNENSKSKSNRVIVTFLIFGGLFVYWYYHTVLNNYGFNFPVFPYKANFGSYY